MWKTVPRWETALRCQLPQAAEEENGRPKTLSDLSQITQQPCVQSSGPLQSPRRPAPALPVGRGSGGARREGLPLWGPVAKGRVFPPSSGVRRGPAAGGDAPWPVHLRPGRGAHSDVLFSGMELRVCSQRCGILTFPSIHQVFSEYLPCARHWGSQVRSHSLAHPQLEIRNRENCPSGVGWSPSRDGVGEPVRVGVLSEAVAWQGVTWHSLAGPQRGASCLNLSGHRSPRPLSETASQSPAQVT